MKQFHSLHPLAPAIILATFGCVSSVGRGPAGISSLRSDARSSAGINIAYQGKSPAELEEQEEADGEDGVQEQSWDGPQQQQQPQPRDDTPQSLVQVQSPALPASSWSEASTPPGVPVVETPLEQKANADDAESSPPTSQSQDALPEGTDPADSLEVQAGAYNSEANNDVEVGGLATRDSASANFLRSRADLGLSTLKAPTLSMASVERPHTELTTRVPVAKPGTPVVHNEDRSVKALFPSSLPQSLSGPSHSDISGTSSLHADPKESFATAVKDQNTCHPPCKEGRGICNDNVCFCKTPYTGTTCQHKMGAFSRFKYPFLVASSGVFIVFGILFAQILHQFVARHHENRLKDLGDGAVTHEVWTPPDNSKKKSGG